MKTSITIFALLALGATASAETLVVQPHVGDSPVDLQRLTIEAVHVPGPREYQYIGQGEQLHTRPVVEGKTWKCHAFKKCNDPDGE